MCGHGGLATSSSVAAHTNTHTCTQLYTLTHLDDVLELGEVPGIPLTHAHRKGVDVLVELVQEGDGLDDHVVGASGVELDLMRFQ